MLFSRKSLLWQPEPLRKHPNIPIPRLRRPMHPEMAALSPSIPASFRACIPTCMPT